jgi:hypothetical protein
MASKALAKAKDTIATARKSAARRVAAAKDSVHAARTVGLVGSPVAGVAAGVADEFIGDVGPVPASTIGAAAAVVASLATKHPIADAAAFGLLGAAGHEWGRRLSGIFG